MDVAPSLQATSASVVSLSFHATLEPCPSVDPSPSRCHTTHPWSPCSGLRGHHPIASAPWPISDTMRYPFVEGRSSFSWEYGMSYFHAVAPRTRTLARGISSTPSYLEKARSPCALTHPPWMNLAEEPLGFRGIGFSPMFALLKPTFSLPLRPHLLARVLRSKAERSPTDAFLHPTASADRLAPFIFGARALDQ
ncbi:hypothetical protein ZIOFF_018586 [Zingiber officinale]|uniref:Uncharacterized protein n=1 Tax=Zingiber officinale TaxID=94328 RepID=A0A8J5H687_ZINOF|nr:hypothetical protein ZIOFF_018586 [Zingiber officinale]